MPTSIQRLCHIPAAGAEVEGLLVVPEGTQGLVLFAHGSGSSRHSPRNNYVAGVLHKHRIATLLLDLLTPQEDQSHETRFDIPLLTRRLLDVTLWMGAQADTRHLPVAYFGASTGAAAALQAAAALGPAVSAVVSRGGRPDLAGAEALAQVQCPTLLLVGGWDEQVLELNQRAAAHALPDAAHGRARRHAFVRGSWQT